MACRRGLPVIIASFRQQDPVRSFYVALLTLLSAAVGVVFLCLSIATPAFLGLWLSADFQAHSSLV
jgi:hypothetical protein